MCSNGVIQGMVGRGCGEAYGAREFRQHPKRSMAVIKAKPGNDETVTYRNR